jgi:hypothetical protein
MFLCLLREERRIGLVVGYKHVKFQICNKVSTAMPSWLWVITELDHPLWNPRTHNTRFHRHKITSPSTVYPQAEPLPDRAFQQLIWFGSYIIKPYIIEHKPWGLDWVRLADARYGSVRSEDVQYGEPTLLV